MPGRKQGALNFSGCAWVSSVIPGALYSSNRPRLPYRELTGLSWGLLDLRGPRKWLRSADATGPRC